MDSVDQQKFEWIWHLFYENKTSLDLPFSNHIPAARDVWQFPKKHLQYYDLVFDQGKDHINNKTIIDIGCGVGCWTSGFKQAKNYMGIDIDKKSICYAQMMLDTLDIDYTLVNDQVENAKTISADTVYMLSVNQYLEDQTLVFDKLDCGYFVMDTWEITPLLTADEIVAYLETQGFWCIKRFIWTENPIKQLSTEKHWGGRRYILHFEKQ